MDKDTHKSGSDNAPDRSKQDNIKSTHDDGKFIKRKQPEPVRDTVPPPPPQDKKK